MISRQFVNKEGHNSCLCCAKSRLPHSGLYWPRPESRVYRVKNNPKKISKRGSARADWLQKYKDRHLPYKRRREWDSRLALEKHNFNRMPPLNMPIIEAKVICHYLCLNALIQPIIHRKCKLGKKKRVFCDEEVRS